MPAEELLAALHHDLVRRGAPASRQIRMAALGPKEKDELMRKPQRNPRPAARRSRQTLGNPRLREARHDPYRESAKRKGPARCTECGAIYLRGRWRWQAPRPAPRAAIVCPACQRIADRYPAGEIIVQGAFAEAHRGEIESLIRHTADAESAEHPLHRIMGQRRQRGVLTVTTTDVHLPHRIGHALKDALGGELATHYDEEGHFARVTWERAD
jgi:hypothetical protein